MISFNLYCSKDHEFEGWFQSSAAFDEQVASKTLACPICGDKKISKALSAPMVASSKARDAARAEKSLSDAKQMKQALTLMRQKVKDNCENVGERFAEEARKIHYGEAEERGIYGRASSEEAKDLVEEGIDVNAIPWMAEEVEH
ncbi:MAG: DUF1178 family protein [Alphaproteobacteria bacterium]|nr:DUF1178 family protein [Alphaproteobacteria bacterium]